MSCCHMKYNNPDFWGTSLGCQNVWQGVFEPDQETRFPMFINSIISNKSHGIASCDWACYPSAHSLLGFIQHVYLPTAFHTLLHPELEMLHTPIGSTEALTGMIQSSKDERADAMVYFLQVTATLWPLCEYRLTKALMDLCEMISNAFSGRSSTIRLNLYASAPAISCCVQREYWCEDVFKDDTGVDMKTLAALCHMAQEEPLFRALLVSLLNSRALMLT